MDAHVMLDMGGTTVIGKLTCMPYFILKPSFPCF